jgi:hypothetical protein
MAIQKSFVIRNGIEVNNNLLVANAVTDSVGIGTSNPNYTLEVRGGIGVTDINILGTSTVLTQLNVGTGGTAITSLNTGLTGFGTASPEYIVDIRSPVSTGQTALYVQGDVRITGDVYADDISLDQASFTNLEVTGVGTIRTASIDLGYVKTGIVTNLSTSGIATVTTASIDLAYVKTGITTNLITTGIASIATGVVTTISGANLNYSGIGSFGSVNAATGRIATGIITTLTGTTLNYSGIGTIADFKATSATISGLTTTGSLAVASGFDVYAADSTFHGSVTIDGNLSIGGTSAVLNAVQVRVEDKDIILGFTTSITPSDDTANHGGVAIASTEGTPLVSLAVAGINTLPDTYKQIMWVKRNTMGAGTTDAFLFNYGVGIGSTQVPNGVELAVGSVQITDNTISATNVRITNLNASGITTSNSYNVNGTQVISSGRELQNIASLDATTTATIETAIANAPNTSQDIRVTGIASINTGVFTSVYSPTGIITTLSGSNINYSGIGSFDSVNANIGRVNTGIVTNLTTSGIGTITTAVVNTGYINTGVVTTLSATNVTVSGIATFQSDVRLGDNDNLYIGDGNDLRIFHNGSNSFIQDNGTGNLFIDASNTYYRATSHLIQNASSSETLATFTENGSVALYFDNSKTFETTGYGATVYGGLSVSGLSTIANFRITPIGSGATVGNSGIVTYYGDGSQLSNIISGVGIRSTGTLIGTGFTTLNFIGVGNTFAVNGTTIDITITANTPNTLTLNTSGTGLSGSTTFNGGSAATFTVTSNATSANTVSAIVARDASGNFSAGTITAASFVKSGGTSSQFLKADGSVDSNTYLTSSSTSVTNDTSTNATRYITFTSSTSGSISGVNVSSTNLQFNPLSGNLAATQFTSLSDATQKTNVRPIENPIEITKQLDGVRFDWINNNKPSLGLIAQEVEKVLPELVETNNEGIKSVSYSNMIGLLIEAIKEQQVRIEELERKLNA